MVNGKLEERMDRMFSDTHKHNSAVHTITRGFKPATIKDILNNGTRIFSKSRYGNQVKIFKDGKGIVIDATTGSRNYGKIITVLE